MRLACVLVLALAAVAMADGFVEAEYKEGMPSANGHLIVPTVAKMPGLEKMPADEFRFAEAQAQGPPKTVDASQVVDDEKVLKLLGALQQVKDQIVAKAGQIKSEKKWVKQVTEIIQSYVHKTRRVNKDIRKKQQEVRDLFAKKKGIDNLILQRKLEAKLAVARKDMTTISKALSNVAKKKTVFTKSKNEIKGTIGSIQLELKKLKSLKKKK